MTAAPDLAPALAVLPPGHLERALIRRFARATTGGLGTPLITEHPRLAARTVMTLVLSVTGSEDEGDGHGGWPLGEGPGMGMDDALFWSCPNGAHEAVAHEGGTARCEVCGLTSQDTQRLTDQARADQRGRDVQRLRAAARAGAEPLVSTRALFAAANLLASAPLSD